MEHVGTGIKRMKETMKEEGLKEPEFIEEGESFKVILWRREEENNIKNIAGQHFKNYDNLNLNKRQIKALKIMKKEDKKITMKDYEKMFKISRQSAYRDLKKLTENELIIKEKKGRSNIYKIGKNIYMN